MALKRWYSRFGNSVTGRARVAGTTLVTSSARRQGQLLLGLVSALKQWTALTASQDLLCYKRVLRCPA